MADVYAAYVDDSEAPPGEPRVSPAELKPRKEGIMAICNKIGTRFINDVRLVVLSRRSLKPKTKQYFFILS